MGQQRFQQQQWGGPPARFFPQQQQRFQQQEQGGPPARFLPQQQQQQRFQQQEQGGPPTRGFWSIKKVTDLLGHLGTLAKEISQAAQEETRFLQQQQADSSPDALVDARFLPLEQQAGSPAYQ